MSSDTSKVWDYVRGGRKAVLGAAVPFVTSVAFAASDNVITTGEWWAAVAAGVVGLGAVYGVKNVGPKAPQG